MTNDYNRACTILEAHHLPTTGLTKATSGFRNTVWLTDEVAVKIYQVAEGMNIEKWIYRDVRPDFAPALLGEGEDYIILQRIHGESLFHLWYQVDESTRRQYLRQVGEIVRKLHKLTYPKPNPFPVPEDWQTHITSKLQALVSRHHTIPDGVPGPLLAAAEAYVMTHRDALDDQETFPVYSDLHFDNLIFDNEGKLWLIDYEMMEGAPRDMLLDVWHRMLVHPFTYAGEEDDPHTKREDYRHITAWLREEVPDLFSHPQVQERVNIYGILYELDILTEYPGSALPLERLRYWVEETVPV